MNTVEANWPVVGDELVAIRRHVDDPGKGEVMEEIPIHKYQSIQSVETQLHRIKNAKGHRRLELVFARHLTFAKVACGTLPMLIPAFMYTVWNILNFEALLRVNLAEYSIVYQINLLYTIVLWTIVFQRRYNWLQWLGVFCMVAGCVLTRIGEKDLKFNWSWALLYVMAQALISAVAGVINEVVYKCKGAGMQQLTLHVQNTALYGYSAFFTFSYMFIRWVADPASMKNLLSGFDADWRPLMIVIMGVVIGLNVAFILKKMNNIVKVFAAAIHAPIEVVVAHFFLGTRLTWAILGAAALIVIAVSLFRLSPKLVERFPRIDCCRKIRCRSRKVSPERALMCCCKLPASQKLLQLEAGLDDIRADADAKRRRSNSGSDQVSNPLLEPLQKIREHEIKHRMPKSHYWSLDTVDVDPSSDFQVETI